MDLSPEDIDEIWMACQEIHTFTASQNGFWFERIIDRAVPGFILREHLARYSFALGDCAGKDVLDMACGTGYGSEHVSRRSAPKSIVAADIDADAIRYGRIRYLKSGIDFHVADACTRWTDKTFDTVLSFETIEHVPRPDLMLQNVASMLRADGVFYVSTPIRRTGSLQDRPSNPHHIREWSLEEFGSLLGRNFEKIQFFGQTFSLRKRLGPFRIPGRMVAKLAKPIPLPCPFFEALLYEVLALDFVPAAYQSAPPLYMVCRCTGPIPSVDPAIARRLAGC